MSTEIDKILEDRGRTHGDFTSNAMISQSLKNIVRGSNFNLTVTQCEGLEAIMCKIARILAGNPNEPDHWRDIQGYAGCVLKTLTKPDDGPR